ncbi:MAG: MFS transporter [Alphaproteobacteria bacterium]|nr:MFS transporter [Alphaproteobacteria bacterium]
MTALLLATFAMLVQQSFASFAKTTLPVIAPAAADALGIDVAWIGSYVGLQALAGGIATMGCGGVIRRYGAMRTSQLGLVLMAVGLAAAGPGLIWPLVISAICVGIGSTVSTPASSHLLARYSPPRLAPLVFSVKQSGVPVGLAMAGLIAPPLTRLTSWRGALLVCGALCALLAVLLQPLRARFDADRNPQERLGFSEFAETFALVTRTPSLRALSITMFCFVGLQITFQSFLTAFLVRVIGYDLEEAGLIYFLSTMVAIPGRILWGWVGTRFGQPRIVLGMMGAGMGVAALVAFLCGPDWPWWAVLGMAVLYSGTVLCWHGVMLAEIARLAPAGRVGGITGGVLSFGSLGQVVVPPTYGVLVKLDVGYSLAWVVTSAPAFIVGLWMLRRALAERRSATRR